VTWAPDYATTADVKSYLRINDTADDVLLALWITAASRAVDNYCGRQFGQVATTETRTYEAHFDPHIDCWVMDIDDLYDSTGLTITGPDSQAITDYELNPANAIQKGKVYERLLLTRPGSPSFCGPWWGSPFGFVTGPRRPRIKVTVGTDKWGWRAVPTPAKTATLLQTARLAARRDSPFGIAGSPSDGSELRLLATLDPDLKTSLTAFRRNWWAA
jgi:hypothetical protein